MIGLKKKQTFLLKGALTADFALQLSSGAQSEVIYRCLQDLKSLGVQNVIFATEPLSIANINYNSLFSYKTNILLPPYGLVTEVVCSYWLDEAFETFVKQHRIEAYRDRYVLLALRNFDSVRSLKGPLFEIRARGYDPVILHHDPRRYCKLRLQAVEYLKDLGCLFQLDLTTLTGVYGQKAQAQALLLMNAIDFLTTGNFNLVNRNQVTALSLSNDVFFALKQAIEQHTCLITT